MQPAPTDIYTLSLHDALPIWLPRRSDDHERRLQGDPRTRRRERCEHRDRVGAVLDAGKDGPEGTRLDWALGERREQRGSEHLDLPAPELRHPREPGAIVWGRDRPRDRLERGATAQHAGVEAELGRHAVA